MIQAGVIRPEKSGCSGTFDGVLQCVNHRSVVLLCFKNRSEATPVGWFRAFAGAFRARPESSMGVGNTVQLQILPSQDSPRFAARYCNGLPADDHQGAGPPWLGVLCGPALLQQW